MNDYPQQKLVTTLHDLEEVFKLMQTNEIAEVQIGELVIRTRQKLPEFPMPEKPSKPVTDEDILRNPYTGLNA